MKDIIGLRHLLEKDMAHVRVKVHTRRSRTSPQYQMKTLEAPEFDPSPPTSSDPKVDLTRNCQMKAIFAIGAILAVGGYVYLSPSPDQTPQGSVKKIRIEAGGAKFVPTRSATRTGADLPERKLPSGVVNLAKSPKPQSSGLSLSDLKARQKAERAGFVTQRNGSASLPRHNDVGRMDAVIMK